MMCSHAVALCTALRFSLFCFSSSASPWQQVRMTSSHRSHHSKPAPLEAPPLMGKQLQKASSFFFNKINVTHKNDGLQTCCRTYHLQLFQTGSKALLNGGERFFLLRASFWATGFRVNTFCIVITQQIYNFLIGGFISFSFPKYEWIFLESNY